MLPKCLCQVWRRRIFAECDNDVLSAASHDNSLRVNFIQVPNATRYCCTMDDCSGVTKLVRRTRLHTTLWSLYLCELHRGQCILKERIPKDYSGSVQPCLLYCAGGGGGALITHERELNKSLVVDAYLQPLLCYRTPPCLALLCGKCQ